jgi:hypothetical protein
MALMTVSVASLITDTVLESSLATYTVRVAASAAIPQGLLPTGMAAVGGPASAGVAS